MSTGTNPAPAPAEPSVTLTTVQFDRLVFGLVAAVSVVLALCLGGVGYVAYETYANGPRPAPTPATKIHPDALAYLKAVGDAFDAAGTAMDADPTMGRAAVSQVMAASRKATDDRLWADLQAGKGGSNARVAAAEIAKILKGAK